MRVLKVVIWGQGIAILILVGFLFWKVAQIYGENPQAPADRAAVQAISPSIEGTLPQGSVAEQGVTALKAAPVVAKKPLLAINKVAGHVIAGGDLREVTANDGILLLRVKLDRKLWRMISVDQRTGAVLSTIDIQSE